MGPNEHRESTLPCFPVPALPANRAPLTFSSAETRPTLPSGVNPPAPAPYTSKYVPSPSPDPSHLLLHSSTSTCQIVANGGNTQPPLFQGAILASPFEPPNYLYNASKPQVRYLSFTHVPHTATDGSVSQPSSQMAYDHLVTAANCTSATDTLSCLRKADAKLLALAGWFDTAQQTKGYVPPHRWLSTLLALFRNESLTGFTLLLLLVIGTIYP